MGFYPQMPRKKVYTTPSILQELKHRNLSSWRVKSSIESGSLIVRVPSKVSVKKINKVCQLLGEQSELSEADKHLLALATDLKDEGLQPTILTDDFAIQNVAENLGLGYKAQATEGINKLFGWVILCPACRRKFKDPHLKVCETCGTLLKRKPIKSRPVKYKKSTS